MIRSGSDSDRTGDRLAAVTGDAKDLLGRTWREWYVRSETKNAARTTAATTRAARGAIIMKGEGEYATSAIFVSSSLPLCELAWVDAEV